MGSSFIHLFLYHVLNLTWFPCHLHQLYRMRVFFLQQHYSLNICGLSSSVPRINSHKQQHLFAPESRTPPSWCPPSLTNSSTPDLNPADAPIKQNLGWDAILWMKPNTALSYVLKLLSSVVQFSCSVVSDSLRPHGLQQARIPCPSPTPGVYSNSRPLSSDAIQPSMGFKLLHCDIICIPYNSSPFKASDSVVFSLSTGVCNYNNNACMLNRVQLCATPWTEVCQASLSMGFPRQEYQSGLPFPSPGNLLDYHPSQFLHISFDSERNTGAFGYHALSLSWTFYMTES